VSPPQDTQAANGLLRSLCPGRLIAGDARPIRHYNVSALRPVSVAHFSAVSHVQPTWEWYRAASRRDGTAPRCPFASGGRCPRFYQSLSLLGEAGFTTRIPPDEDRALLARWQQSDLWPLTHEQATSVAGPTDDPRHLLNFCPEVLFDRFGVFATSLHSYADEIDRDAAHDKLTHAHAARDDWQWRWAWLAPMHYSECPLYSPLSEQGPAASLQALNAVATPRNELDPFRILVGLDLTLRSRRPQVRILSGAPFLEWRGPLHPARLGRSVGPQHPTSAPSHFPSTSARTSPKQGEEKR